MAQAWDAFCAAFRPRREGFCAETDSKVRVLGAAALHRFSRSGRLVGVGHAFVRLGASVRRSRKRSPPQSAEPRA